MALAKPASKNLNESTKTFHSIGGSHTHIVLEMSRESGTEPAIYLGSALTLSYSVYRDKIPVYNCGSHLVDGFSIGNKYVAGSLITMMNDTDEFALFMDAMAKAKANNPYRDIVPTKELHTFMRDDLIPFNIHALFTNEYNGSTKRVIIYDATFINNGQVMSVDDMITEQTMSFTGRDIREQHNMHDVTESSGSRVAYTKASRLIL